MIELLYAAIEQRDKQCVSTLLTANADVNLNVWRQNLHRCFRDSPLTLAVKAGDTDIVHLLLSAKADPNYLSCDRCALNLACEMRNEQIVALLLAAGADPNAHTMCEKPTLQVALNAGSEAIAQRLVDAGALTDWRDRHGCTLLFAAVDSDNALAVNFLLRLGANVNAADNLAKHAPLTWVRSENVTRLLILHGANMRLISQAGTCVHYAVVDKRIGALRCMLTFGADPNQPNVCGSRPLDFCHTDRVAALLFAAGATQCNSRWQPLTMVAEIDQARRELVRSRCAFVLGVAAPICFGLQALELPALVTLCIVDQALDPFHDVCSVYFKWRLVTLIKHF